jgi:hypothetical protein
MPFSDADYATLLRLSYETRALKLDLCFLRMKLASKAGFNPNQPEFHAAIPLAVIRISRRHGTTIDIIESSNPLLPRGFKVHAK